MEIVPLFCLGLVLYGLIGSILYGWAVAKGFNDGEFDSSGLLGFTFLWPILVVIGIILFVSYTVYSMFEE